MMNCDQYEGHAELRSEHEWHPLFINSAIIMTRGNKLCGDDIMMPHIASFVNTLEIGNFFHKSHTIIKKSLNHFFGKFLRNRVMVLKCNTLYSLTSKSTINSYISHNFVF